MKNKKKHKQNNYILFFLFFIVFSNWIFSQESLSPIISIIESKEVNDVNKLHIIDSLFINNLKLNNTQHLTNNVYKYTRWLYKKKKLDKSISISNTYLKVLDTLSNRNDDLYKKIIRNLGYFYEKKGNYSNAYQNYKKSTSDGIIDDYTSRAYVLAANNLRKLGDFYNASYYYEKSILIAKETNDSIQFIKNSIDASINYKQISTNRNLNKGIQTLNQALNVANNFNNRNNKKVPQRIMFKLYNHLGNLYCDRDDYNFIKSRNSYDKALQIALKIQDSSLTSLIYNDLGYLYVQSKNKKAITYLNKALKYKNSPETLSINFGNKSRYYLDVKNKEKALYNIQQSINVLLVESLTDFIDLPSKEEISSAQYKYELLTALIDKAKILLAFNNNTSKNNSDVNNALKTLTIADYLVDNIRLESSEQKSKLFWRKTASEIYSNAVKACFLLNKTEDAFYFMEKNKSLLLLEDAILKQKKENSNLPENIVNRQRYLEQQISKHTKLIPENIKKDSLNSLLFSAKENYTSFIDSLKTDFKSYYKTLKPATVMALSESQQSLPDTNSAYISYILNDDFGYGLLITKDNAKIFKLESINRLFNLSKKYRTLLSKPIHNKSDNNIYSDVSVSIYNILFPKFISNSIQGKKLTVIPDYYLQNIPFESLMVSKGSNEYFIQKNEINYAYSITFLNQNNNTIRKNSKQFLGIAPIEFNNDLIKLTKSKQEIEELSALFSSTVFTYKNAAAQNFISNSKNHAIIHLASHSNANDSISPWIAFNDTKLSLNELYHTENTADLVVLSACKTSLGTLNKGEGVMSLARGFFNTGANSVLSTLWNVNDKSSSEIMQNFYKELSKGETKSKALHLAKLNYLESHQLSQKSPYYWASFVLIGNAESIPSITNNTSTILIISLIFSLILITILYLKLKT